LRLVASPDGADGSLTIHQDARVYAGLLATGEKTAHDLAPGRHAWVHLARGALSLDGVALQAGDAAAVSKPGALAFEGKDAAELLLFDLA
jgi:redox-sensitive bicupin YhaK (pirin superfamily)